MSSVLVSILALDTLFVVGTVLPISMGALGVVAARSMGMYFLGLGEREMIVRGTVPAVDGRVALISWVMFAVTRVLTTTSRPLLRRAGHADRTAARLGRGRLDLRSAHDD